MRNKLILGIGLVLIATIGILILRNATSSEPLATPQIIDAAKSSPAPASTGPSPVPTPKVVIDSATNLKEVSEMLGPENFSEDYKGLRSNL
ncbi:hypothetical protein A2631_03370 [Candidatus Daviesbacteria bacterium RIFCSPHIGHO2_01_FULL_44_29]|uniref:Uncharacterized protein n=1 Tax=Candidatus Daviesbacteria bacterium RIFCSPHIGHO2_02_FULL_43_12 TaxID=1797776 RepID=A0A1F5KFY1_9BACT|nr:MAG: hypothetical protein A2631_03370 [Candidatus Daviesbacteria bacterium RIFCSPHIGHO2_01_FULL_44_29]OGE38861.1 MAG: hypothetical protein A3E86_03015 [Candidatus Daviesbacteria bacterium RIFCSPHIGHO2_12_FULL_47_45]OGE39759.1 MAG: hypothetical protein A3D25_03455 [Candidatus Daviesbacteria bacterium RIFCSPHIGHO2_02_FULL_43_12]OGE69950.1 MAG: hypothetical protein A3B55_04630 [Candidatus Daviesbacteria bacterium RIFCSPLOWO2_01_FULL_43_15]